MAAHVHTIRTTTQRNDLPRPPSSVPSARPGDNTGGMQPEQVSAATYTIFRENNALESSHLNPVSLVIGARSIATINYAITIADAS